MSWLSLESGILRVYPLALGIVVFLYQEEKGVDCAEDGEGPKRLEKLSSSAALAEPVAINTHLAAGVSGENHMSTLGLDLGKPLEATA